MRTLLLFLTFISSSLYAEDLAFFEKSLGKAPNGFEWSLCNSGFMAIMKPLGWHLEQKGPSARGTFACFVTKEKINDTLEFNTGFTVNILTKFFDKTQEHPSQYAKRFLSKMADETKESGGKIEEVFQNENGSLKGFVLRTTRVLPDKRGENWISTTVHNFLIANDQTSTLYISLFESPSADWKEAWKNGEKIMSQLGIISNK